MHGGTTRANLQGTVRLGLTAVVLTFKAHGQQPLPSSRTAYFRRPERLGRKLDEHCTLTLKQARPYMEELDVCTRCGVSTSRIKTTFDRGTNPPCLCPGTGTKRL